MSVDDLIKYYRTQTRAAEKLSCTQSAISNWKARGSIPPLQQVRIQKKSRNRLKADPGIL